MDQAEEFLAVDPGGSSNVPTYGFAAVDQASLATSAMVGCVIVRDGICIAEGYHRRFGGDHTAAADWSSSTAEGG